MLNINRLFLSVLLTVVFPFFPLTPLVALPNLEETSPNKTTPISLALIYQLVDQRKLQTDIFTLALNSENKALRIATLQGLGRIGGEQIIPLILPFLVDKDPEIRRAAAFASGISGAVTMTEHLWSMLNLEKEEIVKQEIYLALGNLGGENLITKMLNQVDKEVNLQTLGSIFQGLASAITYFEKVSLQIGTHKNSTNVNFNKLLKLFGKDNYASFRVGYFLARVKKIEKFLSPAQLQKFTATIKDSDNQRMLARLIGKIAKRKHLANRRLLSWLIEQSENNDVALASESIVAIGSLLYIPQARIQLGKLTANNNPLIAQTALQVLADSSLEGMQIMGLLKKHLKSNNPSRVVAAMSGLSQRQKQDEMTWAVKILAHKNAFIKIRFAQMLADKDKQGFSKVIQFLSKDPDTAVSKFAMELLSSKTDSDTQSDDKSHAPTPPHQVAKQSIGTIISLNTTAGEFKIRIGDQALYTGANFIRLVNNGYYDGTYFSRMLGNFVAQGGDNVGNTAGGSGEMIREEISYHSHLKGTVGMATSGKDTGDAQFFVNISDNIHLDKQYTTFATVIEGMNVVLKLSNGDKVISAKVLE